MKIVVGLGNPGKDYNLTRHNIGFYILDKYLQDVEWKEFKKSLIYECRINNEKVKIRYHILGIAESRTTREIFFKKIGNFFLVHVLSKVCVKGEIWKLNP